MKDPTKMGGREGEEKRRKEVERVGLKSVRRYSYLNKRKGKGRIVTSTVIYIYFYPVHVIEYGH